MVVVDVAVVDVAGVDGIDHAVDPGYDVDRE